ncbi:hypothetical protein C2G38_2068866 [Gigaspora rosea]|uniref:Uncharacterized protein n=1 Tax=Gigaspora rosea TaxID=44941 RepID=A0A397VY18_9GLOM|nr:hypothetical protein C2G38_2068866 [Gigaspora rosea]
MKKKKLNNETNLNRSRVEGLLIRSLSLYYYHDIQNLSNDQLLQRAWEKIQRSYFDIYNLHYYRLCRTAFELLLDAIEENRLVTLGLPRIRQEVLDYLETRKQTIEPDYEISLALSSELGQVERQLELANYQLKSFRIDFNRINNLVYPNQPFNFETLRAEVKRLKFQDLTSKISLKKQELEQLINTAKERLTRAERYILEELFRKHSSILQTNNNSNVERLNNNNSNVEPLNDDESNVERLNELKEILSETLTQEGLQILLNNQTENFNLEEHLNNL